MEKDRIREEIVRFLALNRLSNVMDPEGRSWLQIPGHASGIIKSRPKNGRWYAPARLAANSEFHEETATLVLSYLLNRLRPRTFFDVGAWQGYFSFVAASHIQAHPTVHAFDMRPNGIDAINAAARNPRLPGSVQAHLVGLSDHHVGQQKVWYARMKMFEHEPELHEYQESAWRRLKFAVRGNKERGLLAVDLQVTTLDQYCMDHGLAPGLMKIDVDGYEGKILRGGRNLLRQVRPTILLELHKDEVQRDGISRIAVTDMLFDAGYSGLFLTDHKSRERCEIVPVQRGDPLLARQETDMIVFIPPDRPEH